MRDQYFLATKLKVQRHPIHASRIPRLTVGTQGPALCAICPFPGRTALARIFKMMDYHCMQSFMLIDRPRRSGGNICHCCGWGKSSSGLSRLRWTMGVPHKAMDQLPTLQPSSLFRQAIGVYGGAVRAAMAAKGPVWNQ